MAMTLEERLKSMESRITRLEARVDVDDDPHDHDDHGHDHDRDHPDDMEAEEYIELSELYRQNHNADYGQIVLFDAQDEGNVPLFESEEELFVYGDRGVAVATSETVEVVIYTGTADPEEDVSLIGDGYIRIGNAGLIVGADAQTDTSAISYDGGEIMVRIYTNSEVSPEINQVVFVLN